MNEFYVVSKVGSFFSNKPINQNLQEAVNEAAAKLQSNIKWFKANSQPIATWFNEYTPTERKLSFK